MSISRHLLLFSAFILASAACNRAPAQVAEGGMVVLAMSDFELSDEGWGGINDSNQIETLSYEFGGSTSNSIGHIRVSEPEGDGLLLFLAAPPKFLGNKRAAYNGVLRFDLKQYWYDVRTNALADNLVWIGSGATILKYPSSRSPGTNWSTFEVPLREGAGWIVVNEGRPATQQELIAVLQSLDFIWIEGEFTTHRIEKGDLDNVRLLGRPSGPLQPTLAARIYCGITIEGQVGASYSLEFQSAFGGSVEWQKLADVVLPTSPYFFIDPNPTSSASRFYRAVLVP